MFSPTKILPEYYSKRLNCPCQLSHCTTYQLDHELFSQPNYELIDPIVCNKKDILDKLFSTPEDLTHLYIIYQLLLFHFQAKQAEHFSDLIKDTSFV